MNYNALSAAESAALSSLSSPTVPPDSPALRLVYSRTQLEDLAGAIARTRRELRAARADEAHHTQERAACGSRIRQLEALEASQVQRLNAHINTLAGLA